MLVWEEFPEICFNLAYSLNYLLYSSIYPNAYNILVLQFILHHDVNQQSPCQLTKTP